MDDEPVSDLWWRNFAIVTLKATTTNYLKKYQFSVWLFPSINWSIHLSYKCLKKGGSTHCNDPQAKATSLCCLKQKWTEITYQHTVRPMRIYLLLNYHSMSKKNHCRLGNQVLKLPVSHFLPSLSLLTCCFCIFYSHVDLFCTFVSLWLLVFDYSVLLNPDFKWSC